MFFEKCAFYGLDMELELEPEPELFESRNRNHNFFKSRNRNHTFSKVGTVKNSYGSMPSLVIRTLLSLLCLSVSLIPQECKIDRTWLFVAANLFYKFTQPCPVFETNFEGR
jgi:hypothetical protein